MSQQWLRRVRVLIGTPSNDKAVQISESFRIAFEVSKKDGDKAYTCNVKIWGLSSTTIEQARVRNAMIQLYAGYGDVQSLLYKGIVTRVKTTYDGGEVICEIESTKSFITMSRATLTPEQRAARQLWNQGQAYLSRVFSNQTGVIDGLRTISSDIKRAVGDYASQIVEDFELAAETAPVANAPRGLRVAGSPDKVLSDYAKANNLDIWMEDGVIRAVPRDAATREQAYVLSPASGLIGSPKKKLSGKNQKGATAVEATCLLNGELRMRRAVQITGTRELTGWYMIRSVTHRGDSGWSDEFYTSLEMTPIKARAAAPASTRSSRALATSYGDLQRVVGRGVIAAIDLLSPPKWSSYGAARAEVLQWYQDGRISTSPTPLYKLPDGRYTVASPQVVAQTPKPTIYYVYRP